MRKESAGQEQNTAHYLHEAKTFSASPGNTLDQTHKVPGASTVSHSGVGIGTAESMTNVKTSISTQPGGGNKCQ